MKKLRIYYLYLVIVIVLTSFLIASIIIALCLNRLYLLHLFISLIVFDCCLWLIVIIKKPSLQEINKILKAEVDKDDIVKAEVQKQLNDIMTRMDVCKEQTDELQKQYIKNKDALCKENS